MLRFLFVLALAIPSISFAQSRIDPSKPLKIDYASPAWNKSADKNESSGVLLRDSRTKRMARIELLETENNSGTFVGNYAISWGNDEIIPEIYIAPQEMMSSTEQMKKIEHLILDGTLLRKPFFLRTEKGIQKLTVYDTKEQAMAAFDAFRKMFAVGNVGRAAFEAQATAAKIDAERNLSLSAGKQETERLKMAAEEKAKQEQQRKKQSELSGAEKARQQQSAKKLAEEGRALYKSGDFKGAEQKFVQAVDLDPSNTDFYFNYGITLHRLDKYNKSIVILNMASGPDVIPAQRDFYTGLNYMKLKEDDKALKSLEASKKADEKSISPIASFYQGVINFQKENYDASKANFEYTLDNSSDPAFDKQAETYIEQIANAMAFKKEQDKKFILTLNGGLIYDSNILSVSTSQVDAGAPTELVGYRWTYGASLEYRPVYNAIHEFSGVVALSDMYSTNKSFTAEQMFQNTDPLILDVTAPYKFKGKAFDRVYQMGLTPGYEQINMNSDGAGDRELLLTSVFLRNDHTFMMNENWFSTYNLELRSDTAKTNTGGDDDATATKIGLSTAQTFFQNAKKTEAWIAELGVTQNTAQGKNATYGKYDLAATYMAPFKWDMTWTGRLAYYLQDYSQGTVGRKDNDLAVTMSLRKPFTEKFSGNLTGVYTNNGSNIAANNYNKYLILTTFTWTTSL